MRKLLLFVVLVGIVAIGIFVLNHKDEVKSPSDVWDLLASKVSELVETDGEDDGMPPVKRNGDSIKIASFNVQVLGRTKIEKPYVMDMLARIVRRYDIVAIQEIRSEDQSIVPQFVELINATGRHYDYVVGPRLGRSSSKEQYAFIFDKASVEVDRNQLYTLSDPDDLFHREPLVAWFRVRGPAEDEAFTFSLVNLHVDPDEVQDEVSLLADVMQVIRDDGRDEDDVILLGDFNAGDRELNSLLGFSRLHWAISHIPTNTRATAQYDNLIFQQEATTEYLGRSGIFDFFTEYNMTMQEALEVSDHLPVWAEFSILEGGVPGSVALTSSPPVDETSKLDRGAQR